MELTKLRKDTAISPRVSTFAIEAMSMFQGYRKGWIRVGLGWASGRGSIAAGSARNRPQPGASAFCGPIRVMMAARSPIAPVAICGRFGTNAEHGVPIKRKRPAG